MNVQPIFNRLECDRLGCECHRSAQRRKGPMHCPAHSDETPSLSVWIDANGKLAYDCKAGCDWEEVTAKLELLKFSQDGAGPALARRRPQRTVASETPNLTVAELAAAKGFESGDLLDVGCQDISYMGGTAVLIPYREGARSHVRLRLEKSSAGDRFHWTGQGEYELYGLEWWDDWLYGLAQKLGFLLLPEGESSTWSAWLWDLPALGIPGSEFWKQIRASLPRLPPEVDLVLVQDPDVAGEKLVSEVLIDHPKALVIRPEQDLNDLDRAGYDVHKLVLELVGRARSEVASRPPPAAEHFITADGFIPLRMVGHLRSECDLALGEDKRVWRYCDGIWLPDGEQWAADQSKELLGERWRQRHWKEIQTALTIGESTLRVEPDPKLLNVVNGLLDWRTGELLPHSSEYRSTIRIPVAWRPGARCPRFLQFLREVLPDKETVQFVLEVIGYCLYPDNPHQKAVMALGQTGTGKGTMLHTIRNLLGEHNTAALSLHQLAEDRFAAARLYGTLANICGDLDARHVERSDIFKMLTGQDVITAQHKYKTSFEFTWGGKLLFSANDPPPSGDQSDAYFARWLILPMDNQFRDTSREDTQLRPKLTSRAELEGILQVAVEGLQRLMKRGRFELPESVRQANEDYRLRLDTVIAFVSESYIVDPKAGGSVPKSEMYRRYEDWCDRTRRQPLSATTFYARFRERYPQCAERRGDTSNVFKGLIRVAWQQ